MQANLGLMCERKAKTSCNRTLSHNAETKDFARLTSHPVRGWTGKNKAFCSPGTQNGCRVIKVCDGRSVTKNPRARQDCMRTSRKTDFRQKNETSAG